MIDHLQHQLEHLQKDHAELDKRIDGMESTGVFEDATLEVLKKQRLHLRDKIVKIQIKLAHERGIQEND
jgi:uncharacterized protein YdcH (DUF465 family)